MSRKWTAKDLADHRHDRKTHVLAVLGQPPQSSATASGTDGEPELWELAKQTDPGVPPLSLRLLRSIAHAGSVRSRV